MFFTKNILIDLYYNNIHMMKNSSKKGNLYFCREYSNRVIEEMLKNDFNFVLDNNFNISPTPTPQSPPYTPSSPPPPSPTTHFTPPSPTSPSHTSLTTTSSPTSPSSPPPPSPTTHFTPPTTTLDTPYTHIICIYCGSTNEIKYKACIECGVVLLNRNFLKNYQHFLNAATTTSPPSPYSSTLSLSPSTPHPNYNSSSDEVRVFKKQYQHQQHLPSPSSSAA
ncbi:hypothetical protein ACTA71_005543 [Dictyostelium dimigraforme]